MKNIEILAPAGSYEGMKAAINAGCDAVYIGGTKFGARAYANNLDLEKLKEAIDYAHIYDKKLYLTVNTLLKNNELENELFNYLEPLYECGLDAVIVQDIGVINYIRKNFPNMDIHASTQMTITMPQAIKTFNISNITRVVLSRELSLKEIKYIRDNINIEIEAFVHGALCYCYSGQCLMSSFIGGRSGNRGRCAQPCRMKYNIDKDNKYFLSLKDLNTLTIIPEMINSGINSFKIEGRMKKPEYAAEVSYLYRKYTDIYLEYGFEKYESYINDNLDKDMKSLMDIYNRGGFTNGYYKMQNGKEMMSIERPNHGGILVGNVININKNNAAIKLVEDINKKDILEIRFGEKKYEFTVGENFNKNDIIKTNFYANLSIKIGNKVYRTRNNKLLEDINTKFIKEDKKVGINGKLIAKYGYPLKFILNYNDINVIIESNIVDIAKNRPVTRDDIFKKLNKINNTMFYFKDLKIICDENIFIPMNSIADIKRKAIDELVNKKVSLYKRQSVSEQKILYNSRKQNRQKIIVSISQKDVLKDILDIKEIDVIYLNIQEIFLKDIKNLAEFIKKKNKDCYVVLPYIFRKQTYDLFMKNIDILLDENIDGYVIKNYEQVNFIEDNIFPKKQKEIILDYNLYVMNNSAKAFWNDKNIYNFTAPLELNSKELENFVTDMDLIVYGYTPLMVSTQCVMKNLKNCNHKSSIINMYDKNKNCFFVKNYCEYCYNIIYNILPISLVSEKNIIDKLSPKGIRLDFTFENKEEIKKIINIFINKFVYKKEVNNIKGTKGHFKRGID